jgi:signal transduction histidine kinase
MFAGTVTVGLAVLLTTGLGLVLGLLLPLMVAGTIAHRLHLQLREQLTLARSQAMELRASRARVTHAFDSARRGIERDLHDGAQQGLLALSVGLGRLADRVGPQLREEVESLKGLSNGTLVDLRRLASGTYPSALRELGVTAALREAIDPGITVTNRLERRPSEETEAALYFATLEAVVNASKHAYASTICVVLDRAADGAYRFRVEDDGVGMSSTTTGGTGLDGIADRLGAHGGTLNVESVPGRGTRVTGTAYEDPR